MNGLLGYLLPKPAMSDEYENKLTPQRALSQSSRSKAIVGSDYGIKYQL